MNTLPGPLPRRSPTQITNTTLTLTHQTGCLAFTRRTNNHNILFRVLKTFVLDCVNLGYASHAHPSICDHNFDIRVFLVLLVRIDYDVKRAGDCTRKHVFEALLSDQVAKVVVGCYACFSFRSLRVLRIAETRGVSRVVYFAILNGGFQVFVWVDVGVEHGNFDGRGKVEN